MSLLSLMIISLIQAIFIPGLILSARLKLSLVDKLIFSVPLSLLGNYFLVLLLYVFNIYSNSSMLIVVGLEIVFLSYLIGAGKFYLENSIRADEKLVYLGLGTIFAILFGPYFLSAFSDWDAVVSWNRWALEISQHDFLGSRNYPLGVPAIFSMVYKLTNVDNLQLFLKIILYIWAVLGPVAIFRASIISPKFNKELKLSSFVYCFILIFVVKPGTIFSGYVDPLMATYGALSIYILSLICGTSNRMEKESIGLSLLILASSALVKLTGIFLFFSTCYYIFKRFNIQIRFAQLIGWLFFALLIVFHWYIFNTLYFMDWQDQLNSYGSGLEPNYFFRFFKALWQAVKFFSVPFVVLIFISLFNSQARRFFLIFTIPIVVFWSLMISYDFRGLYTILAHVSLLGSTGLLILCKKYSFQKKYAISSIWASIFFGVLFLTFSNVSKKFDAKIIKYNEHKLLQANDFGGNKKISSIIERDRTSKIISCWQVIYGLPKGKGHVIAVGDCSIRIVHMWLDDPTIKYFLYWDSGEKNTASIDEVVKILKNRNISYQQEEIVDRYVLFYKK